MSFLAALLLALAPTQQSDLQAGFDNKSPEVREFAARLAGLERNRGAVHGLIRLLGDEVPGVREAAKASLVSITGQSLADAAAWEQWWTAEGAAKFPERRISPDLLDLISREVNEQADRRTLQIEERVRAARGDIRMMTVVMAVSIVLFLGVMIYFVGAVSAKIKGWRELVAKAEAFIQQGQELAGRTDRISAELDAKKKEIEGHLAKVREENEHEIERYADMLGKDLDNKVRQDLMTLRAKAERELEQTVAGFKAELETLVRRAAAK